MYRILYAISVHHEHRCGQNKNNVRTLFPPKNKTHRRKGCGWLASRRDSKYKKTHIIANDVVGLPVGDSKNDSLTKMKTY
jgi:hypothetical protein